MKIALLTFDFPPSVGGVQTYLYEIFSRLSDHYDIHVITPGADDVRTIDNFSQIQIPTFNALHIWRALLKLTPDLVVVGHCHPQLLLAAYMFRKDNFVTIAYGNDYLAGQKKWHRLIFNWLISQSNLLVTITQANASRLRQLGFRQAKIIYPGTNPQTYCLREATPSSPLTLLTVGRLVSRKGIDVTLQALSLVHASRPEVRYFVIGDGPDRAKLETIVSELNLTEKVEFLGQVSNEQLRSWYQKADIFIMPSREEKKEGSFEGFGIVYLEANASGLPVIAGNSGGAVEAVRPGETGILVDPLDPEAIAGVILSLGDDVEQRRKMGLAGRKWVEDYMNWDRAALEFDQALQLMMTKN